MAIVIMSLFLHSSTNSSRDAESVLQSCLVWYIRIACICTLLGVGQFHEFLVHTDYNRALW